MYQLTLFIIFIIIYVVQSAPLSHDRRIRRQANDAITNNMNSIKNNLYCAAKLVADPLKQKKFNITLTRSAIKTGVLNQTIDQFSEECKDFTKAMSLKYQLLDHLFNQHDLSLTTDQTKDVNSILHGLQTTAYTLDQYQFSQYNTSCPRLSAAEYKIMYHVQFPTNLSLLDEISKQGDRWSKETYFIYKNNGGLPSVTCISQWV